MIIIIRPLSAVPTCSDPRKNKEGAVFVSDPSIRYQVVFIDEIGRPGKKRPVHSLCFGDETNWDGTGLYFSICGDSYWSEKSRRCKSLKSDVTRVLVLNRVFFKLSFSM